MEKIDFKELMKVLEGKLSELNQKNINEILTAHGWEYQEFISEVIWSRKINNKIIDLLLTIGV